MNFLHICFFLCANFVAAKVSYYSKCYKEFSICLLTSIDDSPSNSDDKSKLTQLSAEEWCKANSSKLAFILDETVDSAMKKFINEYFAKLLDSDVITNGYLSRENNWTWINRLPSAIFPNAIYNTYRYVYLALKPDGTYSLYDSTASSKRKFICSYVTHNDSCSYGYLEFRTRCYKFRNEEETWYNARNKCLKEGNDLATFEGGIPFVTLNGNYWIGQRKESWDWWNGRRFLELRYSNWDDDYPRSTGGDCLCLKARTGKWTNCDCSGSYRYVCIQEMTTALSTNTTPISSSAPTTTLPVGDSTVQFHSTSTPMLDDNFSDKDSGNPLHMPKPDNFGMVLGLGVLSACLLILIIVIVVVICIKNRRRSTRQEMSYAANSFLPTSSVDDYTTLKREYTTGNETYTELDAYETIADENQKNSK